VITIDILLLGERVHWCFGFGFGFGHAIRIKSLWISIHNDGLVEFSLGVYFKLFMHFLGFKN
jgi:hypothetical protein